MKRILILMAVLAAGLPGGAQRVPAQEQPASGGRRLEILFLGDRGHHQPQARFKQLVAALGTRGFNFTYSEDLGDLNTENLNQYDGLLVYANWDVIGQEQEQALLRYVIEEGRGFIPLHCASYCFRNSMRYVKLVGAQFKSHGTGVFTVETIAPDHPVMRGLEGFETWDETYVHTLHNEEDRTVLQMREDEPWTWVRNAGKGRVFYTAYGHDERTWGNQGFIDLVANGIVWAVNDDARREWAALKLPQLEYKDAIVPNYERRDPPPKPQEPLDAAESQQLGQVPVEMKLELFATEPMVINPIHLNWDDRGRLWVLETVDYPNNLQARNLGHDRLSILEDTDGDGRADKKTVFADKLSIPTTSVFANGGVIITNGSDILFLRDTDGDDVADERTVLFTGWNMGDTHAGPSNFRWGFDNWIWGTVGYSGFDGTVGGQPHRFSMGVFRFKPDGSAIEFLQNTTNNTWGLGFTEEGDVIGSTANNNPSWYMTFPRRYYLMVEGLEQPRTPRADVTRDFYPITRDVRQVDAFGNFTAGAGHSVYTARNYPEKYWNRIAFICGPTGHLLYQGTLTRNGTAYETSNGGNLYASADAWSAPVCAEVGPDGQVWFADWYNVIIQHNPTPTRERGGYDAETGRGNAYVTPLRDREHGRIYRVAWRGARPTSPRNLGSAPTAELVDTLKDDNQFWRMHAQRLLVERGDASAIPALVALVKDGSVDAMGLNNGALHALWTLHGLGALSSEGGGDAAALDVVQAALSHRAGGVRRAALAALPRGSEFAGLVNASGSLTHEDARVVRDALLALSEVPPSPQIGAWIFAAQKDDARFADDVALSHAAVVAASRHADGFLAAALEASPAGGDAPKAEESPNLFPNPSFEEVGANGLPVGWGRFVYGGGGNNPDDPKFQVVDGGRNGGKCLRISSERGSDSGLKTFVELEDGATYRLEAWIKTEGISTTGGGQGAMMNVEGNTGHHRSPAVKGNSDWTKISVDFTDARGRAGFNCLFGGYGRATGTAYWDDVSLRRISAGSPGTNLPVMVAAHYAKTSSPDKVNAFAAEVKASGKEISGALVAALGPADAAVVEDLGTVIVLRTIPQRLLFDRNELRIKAGEKFTVRFENNCDLPHNFVLCKPGTLDAVGQAANALATDPKGLEKSYVPDMPDVLSHTKLLNSGEKEAVTVNGLEKGEYPYVCTFPGHWLVMRGKLIVE